LSEEKVRVRFAPSPTGYMHIGNLRTALYNWLFARHTGGTLILRIEDTDRKRHNEDAVRVIVDGLRELGLDFDEGPFFQSDRLDLYRRYARKLLDEGLAYRSDRGEADKGEAVVLRAPGEDISWEDEVKGRIRFPADALGELVIMKSDGFPTYNFACVVDDHEMGVTHVLRGDDHVSNTPKQIGVYRALGWELPRFGHFPMILGSDGERLSKRHGAVKVTEFLDEGYLPHALLNFIALLGWSPGDDREILTIEEMVESFTLDRVRSTASRFDYDKFAWMNGHYIRTTSPADLYSPAVRCLRVRGLADAVPSREWLLECLELYQERVKTLGEFAEAIRFFLIPDEELRFKRQAVKKTLLKQGAAERLEAALERLEAAEPFRADVLEEALRGLCAELEVGLGKVAQPVRVSVTGTNVSAELFKTLELLGKERTLNRIRRALSFIESGDFPYSEEE